MQGQAHRPDPDASQTQLRRSDSLTLHLTDVRVTLPAETVGALAAVLARRLPAPAPPDPSPYLTVAEAAPTCGQAGNGSTTCSRADACHGAGTAPGC
jgi:hypothetical protein